MGEILNVELMIMLHAQKLVCQTGNKAPGERIKKLNAMLDGRRRARDPLDNHLRQIGASLRCLSNWQSRDPSLTSIPSYEYAYPFNPSRAILIPHCY